MRIALTSLLTTVLLGLVVASSAPAAAGDTSAAAPAAAADPAQSGDDVSGCPGKMNGAPCCASCQGEQANAAAPAAAAPCPCQERAKRLREAAERAKQQ